jgi:hypothetical protein
MPQKTLYSLSPTIQWFGMPGKEDKVVQEERVGNTSSFPNFSDLFTIGMQ